MKNQNDEMIASAEAAYERAVAVGLVRISPRTTSKRYTAADFKQDVLATGTEAAPASTDATVTQGGVSVHINLQGGKK
ncbi:MAG: hypothetical protein U1A72_19905 [Sulfuritalea sp.]|nr:hypothetical protein [Sulfuritalea sp.]